MATSGSDDYLQVPGRVARIMIYDGPIWSVFLHFGRGTSNLSAEGATCHPHIARKGDGDT